MTDHLKLGYEKGSGEPVDTYYDMLDRMEGHYPDANLTGETVVTVIYFNLVQVGGSR